ncbi:MAG: aromatic ring-hydroxylating dioxygenase subunit alpha, partial [Novosphingobium sp.]
MDNSDRAASGRGVTYPSVPQGAPIGLRGDKITGDRYYSRDFAEREWQHMWTKVWHVGGRAAQLPEPGDYIMHNLLHESVIMVRQKDGSIRAFYNSCRHRGNQLAAAEEGSMPQGFTCSYHGWRWGLDGVLQHAQDPEDFPQGNPCGKVKLMEVPCATWGGFVWYSMDENAKPLNEYLDPIPQLLDARQPEKMVRVLWRTIRVNTNWKFSPDNFNESYHLPAVHPQMQA